MGDASEVVREVGVNDFRVATEQQLFHLNQACWALRPGRYAYCSGGRSASKIGSSTSIAAVMQTRSRKVEIPNGLSLPLAFGMNTLLMGSGRYVSCLSASASSPSHRCTPYTSISAKSCPSTPGAPLLERHWA